MLQTCFNMQANADQVGVLSFLTLTVKHEGPIPPCLVPVRMQQVVVCAALLRLLRAIINCTLRIQLIH